MENHFNLSTFRDASPSQKSDMLIDGLSYMQSMFNQATQNLIIYNMWCQNMPGLIAEGAAHKIDGKSYAVQGQELFLVIDKMGEQITQLIEMQSNVEKGRYKYNIRWLNKLSK